MGASFPFDFSCTVLGLQLQQITRKQYLDIGFTRQVNLLSLVLPPHNPVNCLFTVSYHTIPVNNPASLMAGWLDTYFPQASQLAAGLLRQVSGRLKGGQKA